jgi:glycosyltransferase involved in cell wall biosynthesis
MTNQVPGISAILIVYNEEAVIERCLKSLDGVVDEIVLIHDGECRDNTLSIARKYTEKIYIEPHTGQPELHKIKALSCTTHPWVLKIDADEFLSEELRSNLRSLVCDERYDLYLFIWPIWNGTSYITKSMPYKEALFRKEKIEAAEFPHKTFSTSGVRKEIPLLLEHQPKYNNFTWGTFRRKWVKWTKDQAILTYQHKNTHFFNYSEEQKEAFHKNLEKQIQYAHPLLIPGWFALSFIKFFLRFKIWKNIKLFKVAVFQGLYAGWLCYYLWEEKRQDKAAL